MGQGRTSPDGANAGFAPSPGDVLALALQPDGRILVTGFTTQAQGKEVFLLRYWQ